MRAKILRRLFNRFGGKAASLAACLLATVSIGSALADPVAQIGTTEYTTLADAIGAAKSGDTIQLLADVEVSSATSLDKTLTLDLNGKTITSSAILFTIYNSSVELTITDSSANGTGAIDVSADKIVYVSSGKFTLEGGALSVHSSSSYTHGVHVGSSGTFVMTGGSITIPSSSTSPYNYCVNNSGTTTITGGSMTAEASGGNYTINGSGGTIAISDGVFVAKAYPAGFKSPYVLYGNGAKTVTGGYFRAIGDSATYSTGHLIYGTATVSGGYFGGSDCDELSSSNIDPSCQVVLNTDEATKTNYKFVVIPAVAQIGAKKYETLAAAILAAQDGDTVQLLADVEVSSATSLDKTLTLDLNGKTITSSAILFNIYGNYNLTIEDTAGEGAIDVSANKIIYSSGSGKVTINGGALSVHSTSTYTYGVHVAYSSNFEMNGGSITIPSTSTSDYNYCVCNSGTGDARINGGSLTAQGSGGNYTVSNSSAGNLYVTGGYINAISGKGGPWGSSMAPYAIYHASGSGNVYVSGGYIRAVGDSTQSVGGYLIDGSASVSGGFFGGSYYYGLSSSNIDPSCQVVLNTDEATKTNYKFVVIPAVAQIGTTKYETLAAAFEAAQDGDTVTMLTNVTQDDGVIFNKANASVTLDLNGKTITVNKGANCNNRAIRIDNGTLTVQNGSIVAVGSGTTTSNGAGCYGAFRVESAGTLYAENVNLSNARPWGLNVKVIGGKAYLTNVTINSSYGGGIEVTEANLGNHSQAGYAELTGCMFTQTGYNDWCSTALSVSGGSELVVNSGTYTSDNAYALYVYTSGGIIEIKDGTFSGNKDGKAIIAAIDTHSYPEYVGGLAISGGKFSGNYDITSPAYMSVSGGIFGVDPTAYLAPQYVAVANTDSSTSATYPWTVGKVEATGEPVAKEGATEAAATYEVTTKVVDKDDNVIGTATAQEIAVSVAAADEAGSTLSKFDVKEVLETAIAAEGSDATSITTVELQVTSSAPATSGNVVTFQVKPEAVITVKKTGEAAETKTVELTNNDLANDASFTFRLYTGTTFAEGASVRVAHISADPTYGTEYFAATVKKDNEDKLYVEVTTSHFSTFEIESITPQEGKVAVNLNTGVQYDTLEAAYDAATAGDTITLLADITYGANRSVPVWTKPVNINLGGHTLTTNSEVNKDASNGGYTAAAICFSIPAASAGSVTISNGKIVTAYGAGVYADDPGLTLTLSDLTIEAAKTGTQATAEYSAAVRVTYGAKVIIESGSYYSGAYAVAASNSGADFEINGGTFTGDIFFSIKTDSAKSVTITGGAFNGGFVNPDKGTLAVSGGTFPNPVPEEYCATGYIPTAQDPNTGLYTVKQGTYVAQIGTTKYESLADAYANAGAGDAIVLLADITGPVEFAKKTLEKTDTITLDLNGKTITAGSTGSTLQVSQKAGLVITDSDPEHNGKIENTGSKNAIQFTPTSGTPNSQRGPVTITGGTISADREAIMVDNGSFKLTINGEHVNVVSSSRDAIYMKMSTCSIQIDSGTITGGTNYAALKSGSTLGKGVNNVTITGGTLTGDTYAMDLGLVNSSIAITDGTLVGGTSAMKYPSSKANFVSGGTFSSAVPETACAAGYIPTNADPETGLYTVKQGAYVAQIGTTKYESLAEAVADAQAGDTVKLLKDVAIDSSLTVETSITLDLNGFGLEVPDNNNTPIFVNNDATTTLTIVNSNNSTPATLGDADTTKSQYLAKPFAGNIVIGAPNSGAITLTTEHIFNQTAGAIGTVTINEGVTVTAGNLYIPAKATTINGGTFDGSVHFSASENVVTINGGVFIGDVEGNSSAAVSSISITGGDFTLNPSPRGAPMTVSGGIFRGEFPLKAKYIADGCSVTVGDVYDVSTEALDNPVIEVSFENGKKVYYSALNTKTFNACDGETVKLLTDIALGSTLGFGSGVPYNPSAATLDLNGRVLSYSGNYDTLSVDAYATVTVCDTSADGNGTMINYGPGDDEYPADVVYLADGASLILKSGALKAAGANSVGVYAYKNNNRIIVTGGAIRGQNAWSNASGDSVEVLLSGGIFSHKPDAAHIVEGYKAVDNMDDATKEAYPYMIGKSPLEVIQAADGTAKFSYTPTGYECQKQVGDGEWETVTAMNIVDNADELPADGATQTYKFQFVKSGETAVPVGNTVGILHVADAACGETTIIGVPWFALGEKITVDSIVYLGNRSAGDKLMAYDAANDCYWTWTLAAGENNSLVWGEGTTVKTGVTATAPAASEFELQRGQGLFLTRTTDAPIYLVGRADGTGTTKTTFKAGSDSKPTWTLVAAPSTTPLNLNAEGSPFTAKSENDVISLPTKGAGIKIPYTYKNGEWGTISTTTVTIGGVNYTVPARDTEHTTIPAGTGFWYLNKGDPKSVEW